MFYATYFAVLGVVLPSLGPWLEGRGIDAVGVGLVTAAFSLARLFYTPWVARKVDRGGWIPGLLILHVAVALGVTVTLSAFVSLAPLLVAFLVIGAGYGTVLPLVEASVLERMSNHAYGRFRVWGSLGFVAVAFGVPLLVQADSTDSFPTVLAAVLACLAIACIPFERVARPLVASMSHVPIPAIGWALLAVLMLHQASHGPYYAFFSIRLASAGYGAAAIGGLWSLGVVAELVAFRYGGWLERVFGLRSILTLALVVTPVRWVLLALQPTWPVVVVAQVGHAATFALAHLAGVQLIADIVPAGGRRNAQALYSGVTFGLGIVLGTSLAGPVWARIGAGTFIAAAGLSVVVVAAWLVVARGIRR